MAAPTTLEMIEQACRWLRENSAWQGPFLTVPARQLYDDVLVPLNRLASQGETPLPERFKNMVEEALNCARGRQHVVVRVVEDGLYSLEASLAVRP
jgi:flagellar biosynthesis regulator FlbT